MFSVAAFGFIGGCLRYAFSQQWTANGILAANLLGAFLLAFLTYYVIERNMLAGWLNTGLGTGLVGAFTTFSSFATTTISQPNLLVAGAYFVVSLGGGLALAYLGFRLAKILVKEENNA